MRRSLRFVPSTLGTAAFLIASFLFAGHASAADLKVMKVGLGSGTVASSAPGITCGIDCDQTYPAADSFTLIATADPGSVFSGWSGDCSGTAPCPLMMSANRIVRAEFSLVAGIAPLSGSDLTPEQIATYLAANPNVNSAARFIKALPSDFKQNWILMSRSESLQTGTGQSPRLLLPNATAQNVFTVGMKPHSSYPGSHPDAIEYMQWDPVEKNFRFHEIVVAPALIPAMGDTLPDGSLRFPARPRGVSIDDAKCSKCHSTRNVLNRSSFPGTTGIPPGTVKAKNKPNWDAYDSWGGMMPFNRDRIYQGSVEDAAFRHIFNLWNWRNSIENDAIRQLVEQLELQPPHVASTSPHSITRNPNSVIDTGHIRFGFDSLPPVPTTASPPISYSFDGPSVAASTVTRSGRYVTLRHSNPMPPPSNDDYMNPGSDEGRGVQFFDLLGGLDGSLNAQRVADELVNHRFATGSVPIDVRPIAMAISRACVTIDGTGAIAPTLAIDFGFFTGRNGGLNIAQVRADTVTRSTNLPRRKANMQKLNLERTGDPYLLRFSSENGLIQQYSPSGGTDVPRLRQEIFRRPPSDLGSPDTTVMGGIYVDRELYAYNTDRIALYRYFLEPLGVSVDKWSMSVRGRSRTYTFADVFSTYADDFESVLRASLINRPVAGLSDPDNCTQLIAAVNLTLSSSSLPPVNAVPTFTDVQRIFNKSCIECHGGLGYPPYGTRRLDFSENETPPAMVPPPLSPRLARSYNNTLDYTTNDLTTSPLYERITETGEDCPGGLMPCGGPPLSKVDIETIRRWIVGAPSRAYTEGDPHIKTVGGVNYDFQSAGEFVLLRDEGFEIQARQIPVATTSLLGPNDYTGLSSCVSLNGAVAVRVGDHRISYQPNISGRPDPEGLQLRIDGKLTSMSAREIALASGGRIVRTTAPGGIQIEAPGGTVVVVTPDWWNDYQVWYMNIDVKNARATEGVMGVIAPGNWLPALSDGSLLGPKPANLSQRYLDLYRKFANAWRVSDATSLFDYGPGISTKSFTIRGWPAESPKSCALPQQPGGGRPKPPLKPLAPEVAKQHCNAIVEKDRKANCEQDVMVTGHPGFAKTYLSTEQIERNVPPPVPVLGAPDHNMADFTKPITFVWNKESGSDGGPVTYRHCVWVSGEKPTFNNCDPPSSTGGADDKAISRILSGLKPGTDYLWKVIAEDGKGGSTESRTRRLTIK